MDNKKYNFQYLLDGSWHYKGNLMLSYLEANEYLNKLYKTKRYTKYPIRRKDYNIMMEDDPSPQSFIPRALIIELTHLKKGDKIHWYMDDNVYTIAEDKPRGVCSFKLVEDINDNRFCGNDWSFTIYKLID